VLTAVLVLLSLDRYVGTNFFTNDFGGNPMMYVNLIWIWGHPEVYILILPIFGVFSKSPPRSPASAVRLHVDGLRHRRHHHPVLPRVAAPLLHDGLGERQQLLRHHHDDHLDPDRRQDLQLAVHDVPRRIRFDLPMMWTVAFMLTFVIGGMTGVMLAVPPADFVLHNSLFLIAHFTT
jgi:cytochrome o ubiquinol oxidase subunit 1